MTNNQIPRRKTAAGVFCIGGLLYNLIEICWRGYTHWSMFLLGGCCFQVIGSIHDRFADRRPLFRCTLCAGAVTALEFLSGCVVNLHLHLNVWDYSRMPFNIKGQVCLLYSVLWGALSLIACPVYRLVRMRLNRDRQLRLIPQ